MYTSCQVPMLLIDFLKNSFKLNTKQLLYQQNIIYMFLNGIFYLKYLMNSTFLYKHSIIILQFNFIFIIVVIVSVIYSKNSPVPIIITKNPLLINLLQIFLIIKTKQLIKINLRIVFLLLSEIIDLLIH